MSEQTQSLEVIVVDKPQELTRRASDVAGLCKEIVVKTAVQIQGRKYVKAEGWLSIATAHGCIASSRDVERVPGGYRAIGEIRRITDGAILATAEGFVGEDEPTWWGGGPKNLPKRPDYAIRAMCQTRAISRVCRAAFAHVVVLMDAGLSTVPFEEVPESGFEHEAPPPPPPPKPAPAPVKSAAPAKPETPAERKARFLSKFKGVESYAKDLWVELGIMLPTESFEEFPEHKVPPLAKTVEDMVAKCRAAAGVAEPPPEAPEPDPNIKECPNCRSRNYVEMRNGNKVWSKCPDCGREDVPPPNIGKTVRDVMGNVTGKEIQEDEEWRSFPMPWGKNAGTPLEDLEKNYLYGLWANYEVETSYNGKPKKPDTIAKDRKFREMLDAAGDHYEFTKKN